MQGAIGAEKGCRRGTVPPATVGLPDAIRWREPAGVSRGRWLRLVFSGSVADHLVVCRVSVVFVVFVSTFQVIPSPK